MIKQIVKIDKKGQVELIAPMENDQMNVSHFTISVYFSWMLNKILNENSIFDFHFMSADSIFVKYSYYDELNVGESEMQLILDESALANEEFMSRLHYLEAVFQADISRLRSTYETNLKNKRLEIAAGEECVKLLSKKSKGGSYDLSEVTNPQLVLSYFYSHEDELKKKRYKFSNPKKEKGKNFFLGGQTCFALICIISMFSFLISFVSLGETSNLFLSSLIDKLLVSSGITFLSSFVLTGIFALCYGCYKSSDDDNIGKLISDFRDEFEDALIMGKDMTKAEEFAYLTEKTKEYIASSSLDFTQEALELDSLVTSLENKEDLIEDEVTYEEVISLLNIEWRVYSKEQGIGKKDATFYTESCIDDVLGYIGVYEEQLHEDEFLASLVCTCKEMVEEPFYGCELEVTRLLRAIVSYRMESEEYESLEEFVHSPNYSVSISGYKRLMAEAQKKKSGALKMSTLDNAKSAVEQLLIDLHEGPQKAAVTSTVGQQGVAMQMKPIKDPKNQKLD